MTSENSILKIGNVSVADYSEVRLELGTRGLRFDNMISHGGICRTYQIEVGPIAGAMQAEHPGIELVRGRDPHVREVDHQRFHLGPNQIMAFNALALHTEIYSGKAERRDSIVIQPHIFDALLEPIEGKADELEFFEIIANSRTHQLDGLFSELMMCRSVGGDDSFSSECLATSLIVELLASRENTYTEKLKRLSLEGRFPDIISKAKKIIAEHFMDEALSLTELATRCGLSRFHFLRLFKIRTGMTPSDYLARFRVSLACCYLCQSKIPIADIALNVGYRDITTFYRQFKSRTGRTPLQYRNRDFPNMNLPS